MSFVSCLASYVFKPFWVYFAYDVRECSNVIDLHEAVQLFHHHLLRILFFSVVYSSTFAKRLIYHRGMGLFLGSLCCSTDLYLWFGDNTFVSITVIFLCCLKSGRGYYASTLFLVFSLRMSLAILNTYKF